MLRKILVIFAVFISAFNFASAVDDKEKIMTREDICIENFHKLFKAEPFPKGNDEEMLILILNKEN